MSFTDTTPRTIVEGWGKIRVLLAAAANCGDLLAMVSDTVVLADANVTGQEVAKYVAGENGASGDTITAYRGALMTEGTEPPTTAGVAFGIATTEYGDPLYLSDTAGDMSTTPGLKLQRVGWIQSRTHIVVHPEIPRVVCVALSVNLPAAVVAQRKVEGYSPVAGAIQAVQFINESGAAFTTMSSLEVGADSACATSNADLADGVTQRVTTIAAGKNIVSVGTTLVWTLGGGLGTMQSQAVIVEILQA